VSSRRWVRYVMGETPSSSRNRLVNRDSVAIDAIVSSVNDGT
jgi:hypothetical protein